MAKLDRSLLEQVKQAFVSMPAGSDPSAGPGPVAGGGMLTQAQAAPMGGDPSAMGGGMPPGGDPSMGGGAPAGGPPGGDPSMGGGVPGGDPSQGGGAPMDPSMMQPPPGPQQGQIILSPDEFINIIQALGSGAKVKTPKAEGAAPAGGGAGNTAGLEAKIDQLTQMLGGLGGPVGGAPAGGQ